MALLKNAPPAQLLRRRGPSSVGDIQLAEGQHLVILDIVQLKPAMRVTIMAGASLRLNGFQQGQSVIISKSSV